MNQIQELVASEHAASLIDCNEVPDLLRIHFSIANFDCKGLLALGDLAKALATIGIQQNVGPIHVSALRSSRTSLMQAHERIVESLSGFDKLESKARSESIAQNRACDLLRKRAGIRKLIAPLLDEDRLSISVHAMIGCV